MHQATSGHGNVHNKCCVGINWYFYAVIVVRVILGFRVVIVGLYVLDFVAIMFGLAWSSHDTFTFSCDRFVLPNF